MTSRPIPLNIVLDSQWQFSGDASAELSTNYEGIVSEALEHPGRAAWWGVFLAMMERRREDLLQERDAIRARVFSETKNRGDKVTDKAADSAVLLDNEFRQADALLLDFERDLACVKAVSHALTDRRHLLSGLLMTNAASDSQVRQRNSPEALHARMNELRG